MSETQAQYVTRTSIPNTDIGVVIGRWQLFHNAHYNLVRTATSCSKHLIIGIGSCNRSPDIKNPFSAEQRQEMILEACDFLDPSKVSFIHIPDFIYENNRWLENTQHLVKETMASINPQLKHVTLFGHDSDSSSWYLNSFPQWSLVLLPSLSDSIHATQLREALYKCQPNAKIQTHIQEDATHLLVNNVPPGTVNWLVRHFGADGSDVEFYKWLVEYNDFVEDYQTKIASHYPYIRQTVDSVVTCKGHLLLIQRKDPPGKGLWALPGGHVELSEGLATAAIRELVEETGLHISPGIFWNSKTGERTFSHPDRSVLCRTITNVFHFPLNLKFLPELKPDSDAKAARWVPFSEFTEMWNNRLLFEDHGDIGSYYIHKPEAIEL